MINIMEATSHDDFLHSVQMILPRKGSKNKDCIMHMQNLKVQEVLRKYQPALRDLEVAMWDLHETTASMLAQLRNLKHLSVRLDHPHTRHPAIKQGFWQESPGSTVWNSLANRAGKNRALGRLQTLNLERAGITDYQLRELLKSNPNLKELRLRKCFNLTKETFKFLANSKAGQNLEVFHFTMVDSERIDERVLEPISRMTKLKVSFALSTLCDTATLIDGVLVAFISWMSEDRQRSACEIEQAIENRRSDAAMYTR